MILFIRRWSLIVPKLRQKNFDNAEHNLHNMLLCDQIGIWNTHNGHTELSFFDYMSYHKDNILQVCILLFYLVHLHQKLLEFTILFERRLIDS